MPLRCQSRDVGGYNHIPILTDGRLVSLTALALSLDLAHPSEKPLLRTLLLLERNFAFAPWRFVWCKVILGLTAESIRSMELRFLMDDEHETEFVNPVVVALDPKPPRLGGALLLPAIGLIVSPVRYLLSIAQINSEYFQEVKATNEMFPGFAKAVWVTMSIDLLFTLFGIYVAVQYFRRHISAPRLMVLFVGINFLTLLLSYLWFSRVFGESDPESLKPVIPTGVACCFWIPYFLRSQRVKETFIGGTSKAEPSALDFEPPSN